MPSPGVSGAAGPGGPGVRDEAAWTQALDVPIFYDPMVSKLIAWGEDRPGAIARMRRAWLNSWSGDQDNAPVLSLAAQQPEFRAGQFHTTYLDEVLKARNGLPFAQASPPDEDLAAVAAALNVTLSRGSISTASGPARHSPGRWTAQARAEALR